MRRKTATGAAMIIFAKRKATLNLPQHPRGSRRFRLTLPCRQRQPAPGWRDRRPASGISSSDRGFQRSSGIIDCSLVRRSSISLLGRVTVSLAVTSVIGVLVFGADDAGEHAAVGGGDHVGLIVLADQGARVEDVREQVVEVGPVRAGQVGPDLAADAEEGVALLADLGVDGAAERRVGRLARACAVSIVLVWAIARARSPDVSRTVPQTRASWAVELGVLEVANLAHQVGRQVCRAARLPASTAASRARPSVLRRRACSGRRGARLGRAMR